MRRLYLFDGATFTMVPESAWINEVRKAPSGTSAVHGLTDGFIEKGWIKIADSGGQSIGSPRTLRLLYEETGKIFEVKIGPLGDVSVDGTAIGKTTDMSTFERMEGIRRRMTTDEQGRSGAWIRRGGKPVFIPRPDAGEFVSGLRQELPKRSEKGRMDSSTNVVTSDAVMNSMSQLIGKYEPMQVGAESKMLIEAAEECYAEAGKLRDKGMKMEAKAKIVEALDKFRRAKGDNIAEEMRKLQQFMTDMGESV